MGGQVWLELSHFLINNMKKIVIYSGRFQPFGPHHYNAYNWLVKQFGKESVYVVTSNNIDENSPLNFEEKQHIISCYGVPHHKIIQCKSPYRPVELLQYFDSRQYSVIFACGQKDKDRLTHGKYFKEYDPESQLKSFKEHGYVLIIPHQNLSVQNKEMSGTTLRNILPALSPMQFKDVVGWFDQRAYDIIKSKFIDGITESFYKIVREPLIERTAITRTQLQRIEQYADQLFKQFGIDINFQDLSKGTHFWERLNDPRNVTPITQDELRKLFKKASIKYGLQLSKQNNGAEGVLKDMETDINIPFIIKWDRDNQEIDLIPKTVMKKPDFKSSSKVYSMEGLFLEIFNSNSKNKHISHLYEDSELTFKDLLNVFSGISNNEIKCYEKFDGQNLQICYRDGQFLASRNKQTILNPLTFDSLSKKFMDHTNPYLQNSFCGALNLISDAFSKLPNDVLLKIFGNDRLFLNIEVLHSTTRNVYYYSNTPTVVIHGLILYDEMGNEVRRFNNSGELIFEILNNKGLTTQNGWQIYGPNKLKFKDNKYNFKPSIEQILIKNNLKWDDKLSQLLDNSELVYIIHSISNKILSNAINYQTDNPNKTISVIKNKLHDVEIEILQKPDPAKLEKYKLNRNLLTQLNDEILPLEGAVFIYNKKQYKLTGSFRYINQILGLFRYSR